MEKLVRSQFEQLIKGARVLASGSRGPQVYLTADNKVVKLFRQKGLLTSNRLWPYAHRFRRNAERLKALGFHSVTVETVAQCRDLNLHLAVYPWLPGRSIRELAVAPPPPPPPHRPATTGVAAVARLPVRLAPQGRVLQGAAPRPNSGAGRRFIRPD